MSDAGGCLLQAKRSKGIIKWERFVGLFCAFKVKMEFLFLDIAQKSCWVSSLLTWIERKNRASGVRAPLWPYTFIGTFHLVLHLFVSSSCLFDFCSSVHWLLAHGAITFFPIKFVIYNVIFTNIMEPNWKRSRKSWTCIRIHSFQSHFTGVFTQAVWKPVLECVENM